MANKLPSFSSKYKICIICEGNEEFKYLERLDSLKVWNTQYRVDLENAEGNGNIPARYQNKYQNGSYDAVMVFCDKDKKPFKQYMEIRNKINKFHGNDVSADEVVIFGNPCTMQIILRHWDNDILAHHSKSRNAPDIEKFTGVVDYSAKISQLEIVMKHISKENFNSMLHSLDNLPLDNPDVSNSTNFNILAKRLLADNAAWINNLNDRLES